MVTIKHGLSSLTIQASSVSDIINNSNVKAVLGYGENVRFLKNGVELGSDATLYDGDTVIVEQRANSKA